MVMFHLFIYLFPQLIYKGNPLTSSSISHFKSSSNMYESAGSTRHSPQPVFPFQPETSSSLFVPFSALLPQQYPLTEEEEQQHGYGFGLNQSIADDRKHSPWSCHTDIDFQHTPSSSTENAVPMSSRKDEMWRSHEVRKTAWVLSVASFLSLSLLPKIKFQVGNEPCPRRNVAQVVSSKSRIKWTRHLHDKFIDCVGRLGGTDSKLVELEPIKLVCRFVWKYNFGDWIGIKYYCWRIAEATPKGILRLMGVEGLTIYHVKSHLQKHRVTRFISDSKKQERKINNRQLIDLET